jgi:hypothetical protein
LVLSNRRLDEMISREIKLEGHVTRRREVHTKLLTGKRVAKKMGVRVWTELIWLTLETSGGLL